MISPIRRSSETRHPLHQAECWAAEVAAILGPGCQHLEAAGSLRRRLRDVKDIEFIVRPLMRAKPRQMGLFATEGAPEFESNFDNFIAEILRCRESPLQWAPDIPTSLGARKCPRGSKHKRLMWRGKICVDVFIVADASTYGLQLALRTGPAEFSKALVTPRSKGGALPDELRQHDWKLYEGNRRIETPTEESYFEAIGLKYLEPRLRCLQSLQKYLAYPPSRKR